MNEQHPHLPSETLQAYLEGELPRERVRRVESHLDACPRCASELDAWKLLFSELQELPALEPSEGFADRVMEQAPGRTSLVRRLADQARSWLQRPLGDATEHLGPNRIQDLLDGALGIRDRRAAHSHLEACATCQSHVEEWEGLFATLSAVGHLEPSPGFQERVMAGLAEARAEHAVPGPATSLGWLAGVGTRVAAAAGRLVPSTTRGWAWLTGAVSLPAVGLLALVGAVVAHPLLTMEALATFAGWRLMDGLQAALASLASWIVDTPFLHAAWEMAVQLAASPGVAVAGAAALWTLVLVSAWVFYRHVIAPSLMARHHA